MKILNNSTRYNLILDEKGNKLTSEESKVNKRIKRSVISTQFKKFSLTVGRGKISKPNAHLQKKSHSLHKFIKKSDRSNRSIHDVYNYQHNLVQAATIAMKEMGQNTSALKSLANQLKASKFKADRRVKHSELRTARQLRSHLVNMLTKGFVKQGHPYTEARKLAIQTFRKSFIHHLNSKNWKPINNIITYKNKQYQSEQLPASKMKLGKDDIFPVSYSNKGICSSSSSEVNHATNLWNSTISTTENGQKNVLFSGIRHGVLSPYQLPENSPERKQGTKNRAQEVIAAALFSQPDRLKKALAGDTVKLRLVSTSLLTNTTYIVNEANMLRDQMNAWDSLSKEPITLPVRNSKGEIQHVKIDLEVSAFNFGVNELALKLKLGNFASDEYNITGLHQLFGSDLSPDGTLGGWVGEYLATEPHNAEKVRELSLQIKTIWQNKSHHADEQEPYKAAERLAILGYEIGAVPCWNCKSGKDRTGMLDSEIKREVISYQQRQKLSEPGNPFDGSNKELLKEIIINSGNPEIQYYNTGVKGNKVMKDLPFSFTNLSYKKRIANDIVADTLKGLSELAKI